MVEQYKQMAGKLTGIRLAVDRPHTQGAIKIGKHWIYFDTPFFRNNACKETDEAVAQRVIGRLQRIADNGERVIVGVRDGEYGDRLQLRWLLTATDTVLPPSVKDGWYLLRRFCAWLLVALIGAVLVASVFIWFLASFWLMFLGLALVVGGGIVSFIYYGEVMTRLERTERHADKCRQAAQKSLEETGFTNVYRHTMAVDDALEVATYYKHSFESATENRYQPLLYRVVGRIDKVEAVSRSTTNRGVLPAGDFLIPVSSRVSVTYYFLQINGDNYVIISDKLTSLFLAHGDDVVLVSTDPTCDTNTKYRPVWALRNLTDGQAYVCHEVMRPAYKRFRKPFMGNTRLTFVTPGVIKAIGWMCVFWDTVCILLEVLQTSGNDNLLDFLFFMILTPWAVFLAPFLLLRLKWRLGYPSRPQRLTDRVHNLLGLNSPLSGRAEYLVI